jgi:hypothetical protein
MTPHIKNLLFHFSKPQVATPSIFFAPVKTMLTHAETTKQHEKKHKISEEK